MDHYALLKLLHVLLFVYWLGADLGVYYSAGYVRNPALGREARATALRILAWIDMVPRYCLVLMLPVGYALAAALGAVRVPPVTWGLLALVTVLWLANVTAIHRLQGTPLGDRLRRIDLVWRWVLIAGLAFDAWRGFRGTGHIQVDWVAAKIAIFAFLVFCGVMLRILGAPMGPALRRILTEGSTPGLEATVARTSARTRPFVLAIWAGLVVAAYVGIAKPTLGD